MQRPDLVVIGAGVMGVWTALTAAERGRRVVLVDAFEPGDPRQTSGDESRILRSSHGTEATYAGWAREARERWIELGRRFDDPIFIQAGVAWLAHGEGGFEAESLATLAGLGIPAERLTPAEAAARWPFATDGLAWVLFEPEAGVLRARAGVRAAARAFGLAGGTLERRRIAPGAVSTGDRLDAVIDTTTGERLEADQFVFAAGPWLPRLFPEVVGPRIRVTRQDVVYVGTPAGDRSFDVGQFPAWIDYDDAFYGIPALDGRGAKLAPDTYGPETNPDELDRLVDLTSIDASRTFLRRRIPALAAAPVVETRVCQYESTTDTHFVIDRHPAMENAWIVGGGSGHGFKHGPRIGRYVVDRLDGVTDAVLDERFSVTRERPPGRGMR
ncbi:MAG TPA: FAD-dependent oxidoreductase, partial [Candidatus Limnocylindrales bacterium]